MSIATISIPAITITAATSGVVTDIGKVLTVSIDQLVAVGKFTHGSGGTSAKFYLQTSIDGTTWCDVACFAYTTSSSTLIASVQQTGSNNSAAVTDGTLSDNTVKSGVLGPYLRLKQTTVGTYAGSTTFKLDLSIN